MKLLTDLISFFLAIIGLAMICIAVGLVVVYDAISYLTENGFALVP